MYSYIKQCEKCAHEYIQGECEEYDEVSCPKCGTVYIAEFDCDYEDAVFLLYLKEDELDKDFL